MCLVYLWLVKTRDAQRISSIVSSNLSLGYYIIVILSCFSSEVGMEF